jgi:RNA polymerase sigma-70 factor, ECF subfamily
VVSVGEERDVDEPDPVAIRAAAGGDTAAFEQLVRVYQTPVWRFLRHLVNDDELARDVTQDTFVRAYGSLSRFRFQSKFSTWLFQIAHNAGVDALRKAERHERIRRVNPSPPARSDPVASFELRAALDLLSPKLRESLLLVEIVGLTYEEAGAVQHIPTGTVKSRVHQARVQLSDWLQHAAEADDAGDGDGEAADGL